MNNVLNQIDCSDKTLSEQEARDLTIRLESLDIFDSQGALFRLYLKEANGKYQPVYFLPNERAVSPYVKKVIPHLKLSNQEFNKFVDATLRMEYPRPPGFELYGKLKDGIIIDETITYATWPSDIENYIRFEELTIHTDQLDPPQ